VRSRCGCSLFFVPFVLFTVGLAGLIGHDAGDSLSSDTGISGTISDQIDVAFAQGSASDWFVCGAGLVGMASAGDSLSWAMIVSSALSWQLGGRQRASFGVIGSIIGLIACIGLVSTLVNSIREATGVAVASASFVAVFGVYLVLWIVVFQTLPHGTTDPGAALPGALVASISLTAMQAISTLYPPDLGRRMAAPSRASASSGPDQALAPCHSTSTWEVPRHE
jgi:hypothetical protein